LIFEVKIYLQKCSRNKQILQKCSRNKQIFEVKFVKDVKIKTAQFLLSTCVYLPGAKKYSLESVSKKVTEKSENGLFKNVGVSPARK